MALITSAVAKAVASLPAVEVPYTPELLATDLATGVAEVLPWVGAGVGGGVILLFAFMGIRKGFQFFRSIAK